ncbi:unnamed protein product [Durusdinium trenchii]|uniref:SAP domain-containing protein n=1 Tax=Durusdinium trenchii TaxID=1381693 RepID=A0ABP0JEM0_9DINO
MRAKQLKQVLTTAWLVSGFVVSSYRSFCLQKPGHRHGLGRLAAPNKDPQGIKPVEENEPRVLFSRDDLQKLTNVQLKEILRALGLKVSGRKADLVERLVDHKAEIQGVRSGKREIPKAKEPAILETDVFIALDKTVQKLETLLQEERVVFLRAGVASGKSTLAQYLCREQPSKYLQVCPPAPGKETDAECWYKALLQAVSPADVVRDLQIAFELLSKKRTGLGV